jgi:hypothetical protein
VTFTGLGIREEKPCIDDPRWWDIQEERYSNPDWRAWRYMDIDTLSSEARALVRREHEHEVGHIVGCILSRARFVLSKRFGPLRFGEIEAVGLIAEEHTRKYYYPHIVFDDIKEALIKGLTNLFCYLEINGKKETDDTFQMLLCNRAWLTASCMMELSYPILFNPPVFVKFCEMWSYCQPIADILALMEGDNLIWEDILFYHRRKGVTEPLFEGLP